MSAELDVVSPASQPLSPAERVEFERLVDHLTSVVTGFQKTEPVSVRLNAALP